MRRVIAACDGGKSVQLKSPARSLFMRSFRLKACLVAAVAFLISAAPQQQDSVAAAKWRVEQVADGVVWKYHHFAALYRSKQSVNVLDVDLKSARVRFARANGKERTSVLAAKTRAVAAVNGGYFNVGSGNPCGLLKIDGKALSSVAGGSYGAISIDARERISIVRNASRNGANVLHAMEAGPMLVEGGRLRVGGGFGHEKGRHPRTAVGLTRRNHLLLVTVDGRTSSAAGMTCKELAQLMIDLGCVTALNLDGGGSTAMWVSGESGNGVVSFPSDNGKFDHGGQRRVSNAVLVHARYVIVADNDEAKLLPEGSWKKATKGSGFVGKDYAVATGNDASASWSIDVKFPGSYEVFLRWPRGGRFTSRAVCTVGSRKMKVNQRRRAGKWVRVGAINVKQADRVQVVLRGSDGKPLAVDAVRFVEK